MSTPTLADPWAPGGAEWSRIITPSKVAAILGVSRYESPYRLWHRMKGLTDPEPPRDRFTVGHAFEPALAYLWREANPGWRLSPGEVRIPNDDRLGFPSLATIDRRASRGSYRRIVEFKTARSLEEWGDEFTDDAPADYIAQIIAQMMFTGFVERPAHLVVMGPFFQWHTYEIGFDPEVAGFIAEECRTFWDSLQADVPPELDDTVPTYECVRELHPEIDGRTVELDPVLAVDYLTTTAEYKDAEKRLRGLKTRVLDAMDGGKRAEAGGIKIADRRPGRGGAVSLYAATKTDPTEIEVPA